MSPLTAIMQSNSDALKLHDRPKGTLQEEMDGHKLCPQQALLEIVKVWALPRLFSTSAG
jgi:hypothetical protein